MPRDRVSSCKGKFSTHQKHPLLEHIHVMTAIGNPLAAHSSSLSLFSHGYSLRLPFLSLSAAIHVHVAGICAKQPILSRTDDGQIVAGTPEEVCTPSFPGERHQFKAHCSDDSCTDYSILCHPLSFLLVLQSWSMTPNNSTTLANL